MSGCLESSMYASSVCILDVQAHMMHTHAACAVANSCLAVNPAGMAPAAAGGDAAAAAVRQQASHSPSCKQLNPFPVSPMFPIICSCCCCLQAQHQQQVAAQQQQAAGQQQHLL
jgi:hypothetical protein